VILLRKNQLNKIALTLTELANPLIANNWLFVFHLEQSQGDEEYSQRSQLPDLGVSNKRYNYFELTEGVDITFSLEGMYQYTVYQMPNETSTDESEGELVETGKMKLLGVDETDYVHSVATNTYINEQ